MSNYFPVEVIAEILKRLPLKSLVKCISVCKSWKSIIIDDAFIISHHQYLQTNPSNSSLFFKVDPLYDDSDHDDADDGDFYSLYSHDDTSDNLSVFFKFPPFYPSHFRLFKTWTVFGCCNGLVCFADSYYSHSRQAVIWNPSILRYVILPKPSISFGTRRYKAFYGFGFDSRNHNFKVVRFISTCCPETQVEVYSLAAHCWRSISVAPLPFRIAGEENKFINGVLHWLAYRKINGVIHNFILTFDFVEEKIGELMFPQNLVHSENEGYFVTGGNLLSLFHNHFDEYSLCPASWYIWVMKEYGVVESWTKLFHFDSTANSDLRYWPLLGLSTFRNNEDVVIISLDDEIAFLDPIKGTVQKIEHNFGNFSFMGDHIESLFLINEKNAKAYSSNPILDTSTFGKLKSV